MFPHIESVTSPDVPLKDKVTYLANLNVFHGANIDEKYVAGIKKKVMELIDSPLNRCEGLLLMEAALQQNTSIYFERWLNVVLANLNASNSLFHEITLRISKLILRPSKSSAYMYNIGEGVESLSDLLVSSNHSNPLAAIECLYLCMKHHPHKLSKSELQTRIEKFLIKHMDTNSSQIVEATASCLSIFPCCTSKKFDSAFKAVLYTLRKIVTELLNIEVELIDDKDEPDTYPLPELSTSEFSVVMTAARLFYSFSVCVTKFLCLENAELDIPVLWILQLINKIFDLSEHIKVNQSVQHAQLLVLVYPTIVNGAFTLLECLVLNFGLIDQTENMISLLKRALEASQNATFIGSPNCQIRKITWRILNIWLKRNGPQVAIVVGNSNTLLNELYKDIRCCTAIPNMVSLATPKRQNQMPSKNKNTSQLFAEADDYSVFNKNRIVTCNEALKVLQELINTASSFQEEKFKEEIANNVFSVCHEIQEIVPPPKKIPFPYLDEKTRKNLYKIVVAMATSSDFNIRLLQRAFAILRVAQKDTSFKIKLLSRRANITARHLLQPKKKFPEAMTNKKIICESAREEDIFIGLENVEGYSVSHSNHENHNADPQILISHSQGEYVDDNSGLSPGNHNSIESNEIQNTFPSEMEYNSSSKFDRPHNTSHSDSENESIMMEQDIVEQESNQESSGKPFISAIHANDIVKNETSGEIDVSSEEENSSMGDEELEDTRIEEEEVEEEEEDEEEELNLNKDVVHTDQNGLASTSEEEETAANLTKSENGEISSEEGSCEEEEVSIKVNNDFKHEIETLEEDERPAKKQKFNEVSEESKNSLEEALMKTHPKDEKSIESLKESNNLGEVLQINENSVQATESETNGNDDPKTDDDVNSISGEVNENSNPPLDEENRIVRTPTPTFDEMCADLNLADSVELAES